ncbi:uncharacterized protein PHALS_01792 [Plasmopara halstedii]|uniref:Uncharacterized protein n=1 Tax=Plasmopara halstedii TaxID=4781 RepID=A0A0P1ATA1_PLAHL|nr:uncharacterized protein PHALS_01792 [Plasmopara halstedii]CEG45501.1 hypothetical protein PHALS_01792 [Plasmopara halstedii]|eukprot:XP_024581870.1 hypothetical protein PHALS_01792 [Plasmopara halstedii]
MQAAKCGQENRRSSFLDYCCYHCGVIGGKRVNVTDCRIRIDDFRVKSIHSLGTARFKSLMACMHALLLHNAVICVSVTAKELR